MTIKQVAALFGITKQAVQARSGPDKGFPKPEARRLFGMLLLYRRSEVLAWAREHEPEVLREAAA